MKKILVALAFGVFFAAGVFGYIQVGRKPIPPLATPSETPTEVQIVGGDRDEHGCIGSAGYSWCEEKSKCLRTWEEPCVSEEVDLNQVAGEVKKLLVDKHGADFEQMAVTVSRIEGDFAQGGAKPQEEGIGGGMWFGAKVNGQWRLVWDGNGMILCSDLTNYPDFPKNMIGECYEEATGKTVIR
jgi:hypothetical protein